MNNYAITQLPIPPKKAGLSLLRLIARRSFLCFAPGFDQILAGEVDDEIEKNSIGQTLRQLLELDAGATVEAINSATAMCWSKIKARSPSNFFQ